MSARVPANVMSIQELSEAEKLNWENVQRTIKQMLAIMRAKAEIMEFPSWKAFAHWYNNSANGAISDRNINKFFFFSRLEPIAHLIKIYVTEGVSNRKNKGEKVTYTDFGLLRNHYLYYRKHGKVPPVANRGRARENFTANAPGKNNRTVVYPLITDAWKLFSATCKRLGYTIPQALEMILSAYIKEFPDMFGEITQEIAEEVRVKTNKTLHAEISSEDMQKLSTLTERWNSASPVKLTQSQMVGKAINALWGQQWKYAAPELEKKTTK